MFTGAKSAVLKHFTKFTRTTCSWSPLLVHLQPCNFDEKYYIAGTFLKILRNLKKQLWHRRLLGDCFCVELCAHSPSPLISFRNSCNITVLEFKLSVMVVFQNFWETLSRQIFDEYFKTFSTSQASKCRV